MYSPEVTFETDAFRIQTKEEAASNPGRYGKALADWLATELGKRGHAVDQVLPEDFGWLVRLARRPFSLYLVCGNVDGSTTEWAVSAFAEPSMVQQFFRRRQVAGALLDLWSHVQILIPNVPGVTNISWKEDAVRVR